MLLARKTLTRTSNKQVSFHTFRFITTHCTKQGLEYAVIEPRKLNEHKSTVIWCHGLGDTYKGFAQILPTIIPPTTRCVLPNAPVRPITVNAGMEMPGWFDIKSMASLTHLEDETGIFESCSLLRTLVEQELLLSSNLVVGGFSQGGAIALLLGLTHDKPLSGIICASGFLLLRNGYESKWAISKANRETPVQFYHGKNDAVVPFDLAKDSSDFLMYQCNKSKVALEIEESQDHEVTLQQLNHMRTVIAQMTGNKM